MPIFWFALMLQLAFAVHGLEGFGYIIRLPSAGRCSNDACTIGDQALHLILPTIVLSLINIATWMRFTRASMLDVLKTDYIRTAAAKGLSPFAIIVKHGLRNAPDGSRHDYCSLYAFTCRRCGGHGNDICVAGNGAALLHGFGPIRLCVVDGISYAACGLSRDLQYFGGRCVCRLRSAREAVTMHTTEVISARQIFSRLRRHKLALAGCVVLSVIIFIAIFAPFLTHIDPNAIDQQHWNGYPLAPGVAGHLLGTDESGRDLLARLMYGARISLTGCSRCRRHANRYRHATRRDRRLLWGMGRLSYHACRRCFFSRFRCCRYSWS